MRILNCDEFYDNVAKDCQKLIEAKAQGQKLAITYTGKVSGDEIKFTRDVAGAAVDGADHAVRREAAAAPSHPGNHAIGASPVAPILNLQHRSRVPSFATFDGRNQQFPLFQNTSGQNFCRTSIERKRLDRD